MDEIASAPPPASEARAVARARVISPAKAFFEKSYSKATLINLDCADEQMSRSIPDFLPAKRTSLAWNNAKVLKDSIYNIVQVPMETIEKLYARKNYVKDGIPVKERTRAYSKLVIRTNKKSGASSAFVFTLVPDKDFIKDTTNKVSSLTFRLSGTKFSGMIFFSHVEGGFIKGIRYKNGIPDANLYPYHHAMESGLDTTRLFSLSIVSDLTIARSGPNCDDDYANMLCPTCNSRHGYLCADPIEVSVCRGCGGDDYCICCPICGAYPCKICAVCKNCPCLCSTAGGIPGGGTSGGTGGSTSGGGSGGGNPSTGNPTNPEPEPTNNNIPCNNVNAREVNPLKKMQILGTKNNGIKGGRYGTGRGRMHYGTDLAGEIGTPVYSMFPGHISYSINKYDPSVSFSEYKDKYGADTYAGYSAGNRVRITINYNNDDIDIKYMHLNDVCVSAGTYIEAGTLIGHIGKTGSAGSPNSAGPHLHLEVRVNGKTIDPEQYFYTKFDENGIITRDCD